MLPKHQQSRWLSQTPRISQELPMSQRVVELLQKEQVTFCVDTNILIEFQSLATLPWHEIAPFATSVRVVVPTKVGSEMDNHKSSSGRLRKRAAEFSGWARKIEIEPDGVFVLKENDPLVTIEFGPLFRTSDLDADRFDLADSDSRIVAEAERTARDIPDLILLADDSLPIRLARQAGLPFVRPPPSWRRPDGPDNKDQEISELKRQLGSQPQLIVSFPGADVDNRYVLESPPHVICQNCVSRIVAAALSVDPQVPRSVLERRYPTAVRNTAFGGIYLPPLGAVTSSSLDQYEKEYERYEARLRRWAEELPRILANRGTLLPVYIEIGNQGDRAAEKVHAEAELAGPFHFEPIDLFEDLFDVPSIPEPHMFLTPVVPHRFGEERPRVDKFYLQDEPGSDGSTQMISWRCEEVRQNTTHSLPTLVVADEPRAEGAVTVRTRGASIAREVAVTAPLRAISAPKNLSFYLYLRERLELVPLRYQEALREELTKPGPSCTCVAETSDRR